MKILKILAIAMAAIVGLGAAFFGFVSLRTNAAMAARLPIEVRLDEAPADATTVTYGRHLYETRGCADCHGNNGAGNTVIEDPAMGTLSGPNLTRGAGGLGDRYGHVAEWATAIRHGVTPEDGRKLLLMPSYDYIGMSDEDLRALVAYLRSLPAVDSDLPPLRIGPVFRILYALGELDTMLAANVIDHSITPPASVEITASADYGKYLSGSCVGCHGPNLSGGKIPGGPPDWPLARNLTPDESGMAGWTRENFFVAMREGRRPDGADISPIMPWEAMRRMTDTELDALWLYFSSLEPRPFGGR